MLSQIIDYHAPFVPITQDGKLMQVIDRTEVAVIVANLYFNETFRAALRLAHM